jgi:hypothetical protein
MTHPLSELSVTLVPLEVVSEWRRCSETADYIARYFAHDFADRETAMLVLSTVINELVENTVKFSSDKTEPGEIVVRQFGDRLSITTSNVAQPVHADLLRAAVDRIRVGDPEALFAERIAHPPEVGSAGIGLIMLRKDYAARMDVRTSPHASRADLVRVEVEVTLDNREVEPA